MVITLVLFGVANSLFAADPPIVPKRGGTLRLATGDPHSMDPALVFSSAEVMLAYFVFNTLLDPNPEGALIPVLVESLPVTSPDGLTHTFRLRQGVSFSNGRELVADDVVYSLERLFDSKTGSDSTYFRSIKGGAAFEAARKKEAASTSGGPRLNAGRWIEPMTVSGLGALDRYTVQIQLDKPDLSFLHVIACPPAAIVPREEVERTGRPFGSRPVGTGPFVLKQWVRGARMRFERNPHYFRAGRPSLDAVDVILTVDMTTQGMMFERGELDFQHYITDPDFARFKRDSKLQPLLQRVIGTSPTFIFLNCELPPFTNRLVRLALNYAVNKEALVKTLGHRCVLGRGPLPLVVSGFNRNLPEYPYDPPRARALLAEAGLPNGFETTLWSQRDDPRWMKVALFVQQNLMDVGVTVHLKEVGYSTLVEASGRRRTVPMGVYDWVTIFDDPKETLDTLLNGNNITEERCSNNAFYSNPRVDQLFRDAVAESDATRRLEIYREIEGLVVQDAPWIFLVQLNTEMIVQPWLKGFKPRGFWPTARLENTWIER